MNVETDNATRLSGICEYRVLYRVYPSGLLSVTEWPMNPITGWVEPHHVSYRKLIEPVNVKTPSRKAGGFQGKLWI